MSSATRRSPNRRNVHRSRPAGGLLQATATSVASAFPSSTRWREGRAWGLRRRAASSPSSTNRWRTRATVTGETSTAAATARSVTRLLDMPWSAFKSTRACVNLYAAVFPLRTNACSWARSSSCNRTTYLFRMAPPAVSRLSPHHSAYTQEHAMPTLINSKLTEH